MRPRATVMGSARTVLLLVAALSVALFAALWLATRTDTEGASALATSRSVGSPQAPEGLTSTRLERPADAAAPRVSTQLEPQPEPPASASSTTPEPVAVTGHLLVEVVSSSGEPLPEFVLYVKRDDDAPGEQITDAWGRARFEHLEVGSWKVLLGDHERPVLTSTPLEVRADETNSVKFLLPQALTEIEVEVVDEAGRPAPGVQLKTRCERGGVSRAVTDHAGRARLRHVSLGVVRVFATDERLGRGNHALEIAMFEQPKIQIRLATRDSAR